MKKMKRFCGVFATSAVLALALVLSLKPQEPFEVTVIKAVVSKEVPLTKEEKASLTPSEAAAGVLLGRSGFEAARAYPHQTGVVLELVGDYPELREVLERYHWRQVIPVLYLFATEESQQMKAEATAGNVIGGVVQFFKEWRFPERESFSIPELSSEERVFLALIKIKEDGHSFLSRFDLVPDEALGEEVAKIQYLRAGTGIVGNFFVSGVYNLERNYHRGEVGVSDVGWAALDVAVIAASLKILKAGKLAKVGKTAKVGKAAHSSGAVAKATHLSSRLVPRGVLAKGVKWGAIAGVAYMAVYHPGVLLGAIGYVAGSFGIPGVVAMFALILFFLWPLLGLLFWAGKAVRSLSWVARPIHSGATWVAGKLKPSSASSA